MSGKKTGWFGRELPKHATSAWNPFPPPNPTPQLSKEYVYAGSRLLAVEDANATAAPPADIAVWRPTNGYWYIMGQTGSAQSFEAWGAAGDTPMPGDYDGDGKTDIAVYRAGTGYWWIYYSSTATYDSISWGASGDKPVAADFDGDGQTDLGIVRWNATNSIFDWYLYLSGGGTTTLSWGIVGDIPGAADFDGDGKADVGMYRPGLDEYWWYGSSDAQAHGVSLNDGDVVVLSDYDGDGKADPAVFKSSTAYWYIHQSTTNSLASVQWGSAGASGCTGANCTGILPVHNDYDLDGKTDLAVFNNASTAMWTIRRSSNNTTRTEYWGTTDDIPVPAFYRR